MTAQRLHTVTGATNYTGMYIAQLLLQQGHRVQSITHHHPSWGSPFGDRVPLHPFNFDQPIQENTGWHPVRAEAATMRANIR